MRHRSIVWALVVLVTVLGLHWAPAATTRVAIVAAIEGPIGPATAAFVEEAIAEAERRDARLLILQIDTPGGLDTAMRSIIKAIEAARIPVVGHVAPTGARAASAGTYMLYACHVAAMAPGTNLGAATPVQIGGLGGGIGGSDDPGGEGDSQANHESGDAMRNKLVNDAAAYLRSLADLRGRNADWAERAVREGASLPAEEAAAIDVIDLVAKDIPALLAAIDGRTVTVQGAALILETDGLRLIELEPDWQTRLLAIISNPNVAYILMLIGIYGLIYELANPGAVFPGTVGAVSLLLALYAFQLLPVSYAGMALIVLGLALMMAEAFVPSFGALGVGGIAAFVVGSLILIDTDVPGLGLSLPLVLSFAVTSALLLFFIIAMAIRAYRRPVKSGAEALVGAQGRAPMAFCGDGKVHVHGETWTARSTRPILADQVIKVHGRDGLVLLVEPDPLVSDSLSKEL